MRKIISFNMVSIDGYIAKLDGNIDWHVVDKDFNILAITNSRRSDTLLFGRVTYQLFENYWPFAKTMAGITPEDLVIADWINTSRKIVFSNTLDPSKLHWHNTEIISKEFDIKSKIELIKQEEGKDIMLFGSSQIVSLLTKLNLIDEYNIMIAPVVLGTGKPQFPNFQETLKFKLLETKAYNSGNVMLKYVRTE